MHTTVAHSNTRALSLRSAEPVTRTVRAARKIVHAMQIEQFTDGPSGAGFKTWESGRLAWYAATEQNVRDVLWNRWRHRSASAAAVREAVRIIREDARRQCAGA